MSLRRDLDDDRTRAAGTVTTAAARGRAAVVSLSFWSAVCLPVVLVGLLAVGIETATHAAAFLAVAGLEVLALVLGRTHRPG